MGTQIQTNLRKALGNILAFIDLILIERTLIKICLVVFLIKVSFVFFAPLKFNFAEDYSIATHIANGDGYEYADLGKTAMKVPMYPLFLSVFVKAFGQYDRIVIAIIQSLMMTIVGYLIFKIGKEINQERIGKIAALIYLIHPSYFYYATVLEVTNLFVPLAAYWVLLYIIILNQKCTSWTVAIQSILTGIIFLTQPIAIIPMIIALLILIKQHRLREFSVIMGIAIAITSVWAIRNYIVFERVILSKSSFWGPLYVGFLPEQNGDKRFDVIPDSTKSRIDSLWKTMDEVKMEPIYKAIVLKTISENPSIYLQKFLYQCKTYWWIAPRYASDKGSLFLFVRKLPVITLNLLFVIGIFFLWKQDSAFTLSILCVLLYFTLVYGLVHATNTRFKLDVEWLELFAAAALFEYILLLSRNPENR